MNILDSDIGYDFQVQNGIIRLRGGLFAVVADTPARVLRNLSDRQKENIVIAWVTLKTYNQNWMKTIFNFGQLEANGGLHTHLSKEYAVTKRSVLLDAPYFSVTEHLPQDIMHVILEGALS